MQKLVVVDCGMGRDVCMYTLCTPNPGTVVLGYKHMTGRQHWPGETATDEACFAVRVW